jgi:hypothetical protein
MNADATTPLVEPVEATAAYAPDLTQGKVLQKVSESLVDKGFRGLRVSVVTA